MSEGNFILLCYEKCFIDRKKVGVVLIVASGTAAFIRIGHGVYFWIHSLNTLNLNSIPCTSVRSSLFY